MDLVDKINDWKKYPNALGSEAQAAVIVGEAAQKLGEEVPDHVSEALRILAYRGTMRDIASAIGSNEELNVRVPSFHDVVDVGAMSIGLSWTEAITKIVGYLDSASDRL